MQKKIKITKGLFVYLLGIGVVALILASIILGRATRLLFFHGGFLIGLFLFLEIILYILHGRSLFSNLRANYKQVILIFVLGSITGIFIFDLTGILIFRTWFYPTLQNPYHYSFVAFFGWGLFFLMLYDSYLLLHSALNKKVHRFGLKKSDQGIFSYIGITGLPLLLLGVGGGVLGIQPVLSSTISAFGVWFVLENLEFEHTKRTLLIDLLHGNWRPLLSILIGSLIVGLIWEFMNVPMQIWVYQNIPLSHYQILGVPVVIILSWVWLYIIFLSLYRIVSHKDKDLWN